MPSNKIIYDNIIKALLYLSVILLLILAIFPLFWLISTSLRSGLDVFKPSLFPAAWTIESYSFIFKHSPFFMWFKNSVFISAISTCFSVIIASLAAYSLSRFVTSWKKFLSKSILMAYMFPPILLVLPLFILFVNLGFLDKRSGLVFAYSMSSLPFSMWLLTAYFETIPKELDQAAKIDGASNNCIFWRIIFPIATPGLATAAIFVFINAWNEFLLALILINSDGNKTLPIGLYSQMGGKAGELVLWNTRMATSALVILPMLLVFLSLNKYISKGLTAGALKG